MSDAVGRRVRYAFWFAAGALSGVAAMVLSDIQLVIHADAVSATATCGGDVVVDDDGQVLALHVECDGRPWRVHHVPAERKT